MRCELCPPLFTDRDTAAIRKPLKRRMLKTASKLNEFEAIETIGTGSFGTCKKVSRKLDGKVWQVFFQKCTSTSWYIFVLPYNSQSVAIATKNCFAMQVFVWKEVGYGGMSEKEKQLLVQEVNLLRELRHPHIVRYHDRIIDREQCTLYIIMEYCEVCTCGYHLLYCIMAKLSTCIHLHTLLLNYYLILKRTKPAQNHMTCLEHSRVLHNTE